MKKRIEGIELLTGVPDCGPAGPAPAITLRHGLRLDDGNCWQYPTVLVGGVGTGKTALLSRIRDAVLAQAHWTGDNVVIFAAKPDMLRSARPEDLILSVSAEDPACCWNIFAELEASDAPALTAREISAALFAEAKEKTTQRFFPAAAEDCFRQTILYMDDYRRRTGDLPSNRDLVDFLETTPIHGEDGIPGWLDLAESQPFYFGMMRDYIGNGSEQGLGVLSELRTMLTSSLYGSFARAEGTFSALQALKRSGRRIYLYYDYAKSGHSALVTLKIILDLLLKQSLSPENRHRTWFLLDEFSLLPKLEHLPDALSYGRDPSGGGTGGCRILAAVQSAKLLTRHYSVREAEVLLSLFPNVICLRVMDPMSRALLSDRYGTARYQYSYAGVGDRVHFVDCTEPVVSDYHFSLLRRPGQAIMSLPALSECPFFYDGYEEV